MSTLNPFSGASGTSVAETAENNEGKPKPQVCQGPESKKDVSQHAATESRVWLALS